eukprot:719665-Rhodomonas_salina.1
MPTDDLRYSPLLLHLTAYRFPSLYLQSLPPSQSRRIHRLPSESERSESGVERERETGARESKRKEQERKGN